MPRFCSKSSNGFYSHKQMNENQKKQNKQTKNLRVLPAAQEAIRDLFPATCWPRVSGLPVSHFLQAARALLDTPPHTMPTPTSGSSQVGPLPVGPLPGMPIFTGRPSTWDAPSQLLSLLTTWPPFLLVTVWLPRLSQNGSSLKIQLLSISSSPSVPVLTRAPACSVCSTNTCAMIECPESERAYLPRSDAT